MINKKPSSANAEKRVLWEVRQRYKIHPPIQQQHASRRTPMSSHVQIAQVAEVPPKEPPRIRPSHHAPHHRPRRSGGAGRWARRIFLFLVLVAVLSGGIFGYKILAASNKISTTKRSVLGQLSDLLFSQGKLLRGESDDRINILLLAIGGQGHDGANLADSIMVASFRPSDGHVALFSIPRDLYVKVPGEEYFSKINAVHAYGEAKKSGHGPELLRQEIETVTGLKVHYYARIDFTAFKQAVESVGGVDITIPNGFYDYWHKIDFRAGTEHMNGDRALAYVRARYVEGPEGGDFKRTARQQQMLMALRKKIFSVNTAFDFNALNGLLNSISDNVRTDAQPWEMKRAYELIRKIDDKNVRSVVLSSGTKGVLVGTTEVLGGIPASVLKTRTGDFSEIHKIAAEMFTTSVSTSLSPSAPPGEGENTATISAVTSPAPTDTPVASATPSISPTPRVSIKVEIRNGTLVTGLGQRTGTKLEGTGYDVIAVSNAVNRATEQSTIYILNSKLADQGKALGNELKAQTDSGLPKDEKESAADILVILGSDAAK